MTASVRVSAKKMEHVVDGSRVFQGQRKDTVSVL